MSMQATLEPSMEDRARWRALAQYRSTDSHSAAPVVSAVRQLSSTSRDVVDGRWATVVAATRALGETSVIHEEWPFSAGDPRAVEVVRRDAARPLGRHALRVVAHRFPDGLRLVVAGHQARLDRVSVQHLCDVLAGEDRARRIQVWPQATTQEGRRVVAAPPWHEPAHQDWTVPEEALPFQDVQDALDACLDALGLFGVAGPVAVGLQGEQGDFLRFLERSDDDGGGWRETRPDASVLPAVGVQLTTAASNCLVPPPFETTIEIALEPGDDAGLVGRLRTAGIAPGIDEQLREVVRTRATTDGSELLSDATRSAVLAVGAWDRTGSDAAVDHGGGLVGAFRRVVAAHPQRTAVSDGKTSLSYEQLCQSAEAIAAGLREHGVRPSDRVGICLDGDRRVVVALLAVLMTGGSYVPLDPRYPADRLAFVSADAGLTTVIVDAESPEFGDYRSLDYDRLLATSPGSPASVDASDLRDDSSEAYLIYTSGSTGKPKGVSIPDGNVRALIEATTPLLGLDSDDIWTKFHSASFDFSVWEVWGALLTGAHVVALSHWESRDPEAVHTIVCERRVTILSLTPTAFAAFRAVDARKGSTLALRRIVLGGEAFIPEGMDVWFRNHPHDRCQVVNMYGITETTVHVTHQHVTPRSIATRATSVGRPLPGWWVSVRDAQQRILPLGAVGEIFVGGRGVANGYVHRDELTRERFLCDDLTGETIYRSGDLGRLWPDGTLEHLGRVDEQVKVRGYRIELGELRAALTALPLVSEAVLVHTPDDAGGRVDGFVVGPPPGALRGWREALAGRLPAHMLPSTVTAVARIPLTPNGKADHASLRTMREDGSGQQGQVPVRALDEGTTADRVLTVWQSVLGAGAQLDDDFFEQGGNSIMAVRLSAALRRAGMPAVAIRDLYRHSTARALATLVAGSGAAS